MMRLEKHIWIVLAVIGWVMVCASAVGAQQPKSGGTLRIAWEADITGLDPHMSAGIQAQWMVGNIYKESMTLLVQEG